MVMIDPPLLDPSLGDRDSKDHGDSASTWSNGDPSLSKTPFEGHRNILFDSFALSFLFRFSFYGAMKYCDRKLKSRVHAISNRRMT